MNVHAHLVPQVCAIPPLSQLQALGVTQTRCFDKHVPLSGLPLALPCPNRFAAIPPPKRVHPVPGRLDVPAVSVRVAPEGALAQVAVPMRDLSSGALLVSPLVPIS